MKKDNIGGLLETVILNEREGNPRYLAENRLVALRTIRSPKVCLYDLEKNKGPWSLFQGEKDEFVCEETNEYFNPPPEVCCISAEDNVLVAASCEYRKTLHVWTFPHISLSHLIEESEKQAKQKLPTEEIHFDIGEKDESIHFIELMDGTIYFAENQKIEKRSLSALERSRSKKLQEIIWSLHCSSNGVYCGLSTGEIKEYDRNLNLKNTYKTGKKSWITKIKTVEFGGKNHIFGINKNGEVYLWLQGQSKGNKIFDSAVPCFDVQKEKFKHAEILCLYAVREDYSMAASPIALSRCTMDFLEEEGFRDTFQNPCGEHIKDISAQGDAVYMSTDNSLTCMMDKEQIVKEIKFKELEEFKFVIYKTRGVKK